MVVSIGLSKSVLKSSHVDRWTVPVNEWLLLNPSDLPINKGETEGSGEMRHMVLSSPLYFKSKIALGTMSAPPAGPVVPTVSKQLSLRCYFSSSSALQVPQLQKWCFPEYQKFMLLYRPPDISVSLWLQLRACVILLRLKQNNLAMGKKDM